MNDTLAVEARFDKDGKIYPKRFEWKGLHYLVESVGRQWVKHDITHILVMVGGDKVFELSFDPSTTCWHLLRSPLDFGRGQAV
jgi:hypothetical protein